MQQPTGVDWNPVKEMVSKILEREKITEQMTIKVSLPLE